MVGVVRLLADWTLLAVDRALVRYIKGVDVITLINFMDIIIPKDVIGHNSIGPT